MKLPLTQHREPNTKNPVLGYKNTMISYELLFDI